MRFLVWMVVRCSTISFGPGFDSHSLMFFFFFFYYRGTYTIVVHNMSIGQMSKMAGAARLRRW